MWRSFGIIFGLGLLAFGMAEKSHCVIEKELIPTDVRIRAEGYPAESHFLETADGYVLNLFRIPFSPKLQNQNAKRPVVLLQHGLLSNSDCWISTGPDHAMAYLMADAGFDVWMGNARGTTYSRKNTKIPLNNPKFWHFDWHEIGTIDVPTMIDFIIGATGEPEIHYVGHSQGTTVYFVMMSECPEYNMKIKSAHMLAPCAFFEHGRSAAFKVASPLVGTPGGVWNLVLQDRELLRHSTVVASPEDNEIGLDPSLAFLRKNFWTLLAADSNTNVNETAMQILLESHPGGGSGNQFIHFVQLSDYNKGRFCQMDYGPEQNQQIYGHSVAPDYNLANIRAPTYLYSSQNDILCGPSDVNTLVANTPYLAGDYRVPEPTFNHFDFIVAHNMKELVNDRVLENICKHEEDSLQITPYYYY